MRERCSPTALALLVFLGCHCRAEPAPSAAPSSNVVTSRPSSAEPTQPVAAGAASSAAPVSPTTAASVASASTTASAGPASTTAPAGSASTAAPLASAAPAATDEPPLVGPDGNPLPQTEERPSVTTEGFKRRMERLARAIVSGDPDEAKDTFFPLVAYVQVKDVQKPERDYRYRLIAHFERDVRDYRKALGKDAGRAEFLGVSVPEERVEWMKPGKEGNRVGYFRVLRSSLRFRLPNGKELRLELTSMISWRGQWYVVHLHGFD